MIETSQEFIDNMRGMQTTSARITILDSPEIENYGYTYTDIDDVCNLTESGNGTPDLKDLRNCVTYETGNYAIFENDGIDLNGMQVISKTAKNNHYGIYSNSLTNIDGNIVNEENGEIIDYIVSWYYDVVGRNDFNIVFSKIKKEYAIDFDLTFAVDYFDDMQSEIISESKTIEVRNNNNITYTLKAEDVPYYDKPFGIMVYIKIKKWSKVNSKIKINSIYMGNILEYNDEEILNLKVTKEVDLNCSNLPSKQIDLTLQDIDETYNIFNPKGKLANLNSNSKISLELGTVIDNFIYFVKVDEWIATTPKKEPNSLEISITGIGRINKLSEESFCYNYYNKVNIGVLDSGGEKDTKIRIDENLLSENIQMRTQYNSNISSSEGIRKMAEASMANVYEDIDNFIIIKRIKESEAVASINVENMFLSPEITKIENPKIIEIKNYYPKTKDQQEICKTDLVFKSGEKYFLNYNVEHTAPTYSAKLLYRNFFKEVMETLGLESADYELDITNNVAYYDSRCIVYGFSDWNDCELTVKGNVVEISNSTLTFTLDEKLNSTSSIDNESIENNEQAELIFEWLKSNYNKAFKYKVELQDTFTYELGDSVYIESNVYENEKMIVRKAIVVGIEYEYNGALHYNLTLRGA